MDKNQEMYDLGARAWGHRSKLGFSKGLLEEIKMESVRLVINGFAVSQVAKVLEVTSTTLQDWKRRYELNQQPEIASFSEVAVTDDKTKYEIRLSAYLIGCRVELTGTDYSLLQRLLRKLGS